MKFILFLLLSISINLATYAQQYFVRGKVSDKTTGAALSYTNIRVMNSMMGTAANKNGDYEIRLSTGKYKLIASFIGGKIN